MMLSMGESRISSKKEVKPELSAEIVINFPEEIILNFPEKIIEAILLRLPVRSLLVLKCVCKSWYSLISSNYFIQAHLRFSKEHTNIDRWRLIFHDVSKSAVGEWPSAIKHCSFLPLPSGAAAEAVCCGIPMESPGFAKIVGVCNGLICVLVCNEYIYLCNPSTREIKKLPDLGEKGLKGDMFGFGFDEANEDYKVVWVIYSRYATYHSKSPTYPASIVYSLKSNSWKPTDTLRSFSREYDSDYGVFVSQRLHWSRRLRNNRYEIISFDLANEKWKKTVIPGFYGQSFGYCVLFGFGGCLSALCKSPEQEAESADVWVLKEYRNRQSWRKLLHIPQFKTRMLLLDRGAVQYVKPNQIYPVNPTRKQDIGSVKCTQSYPYLRRNKDTVSSDAVQSADGPNGDTIVLLDSMCRDMDLITYELKDSSFTQVVGFRRMNKDSVFQEQIFIESLVPLEFNRTVQYAPSSRKVKFIECALILLFFVLYGTCILPQTRIV